LRILFLADIHIKLGQRNIPLGWQWNRFEMLAETIALNIPKYNIEEIVIGGDLLDVPKPSYDEVALMLRFLKKIATVPVKVFHGNHEALSKTKGCLDVFGEGLLDNVTILPTGYRSASYDVIDYFELHQDWKPQQSKLLFTHVRGAIPPHVQPEIELSKFKSYELVIAGDLHSHKNSQENIIYPGSPITTSIHRGLVSGSNGFIVVDTRDLKWEWVELKLPQAIRVTLSPGEPKPKEDGFHHYIYEVKGTIDELATVEAEDGVEKKVEVPEIIIDELQGDSIEEEVVYYAKEKLSAGEDVVSRIPSIMTDLRNTV